MIYKKDWDGRCRVAGKMQDVYCYGWFLFGFIPLYVVRRLR